MREPHQGPGDVLAGLGARRSDEVLLHGAFAVAETKELGAGLEGGEEEAAFLARARRVERALHEEGLRVFRGMREEEAREITLQSRRRCVENRGR
ncbi:MAG: hypothetical protein O3A20_08275 [Planctomycetota bacterium]|nr:hypothetical protein [Planctomycetota bacterium]